MRLRALALCVVAASCVSAASPPPKVAGALRLTDSQILAMRRHDVLAEMTGRDLPFYGRNSGAGRFCASGDAGSEHEHVGVWMLADRSEAPRAVMIPGPPGLPSLRTPAQQLCARGQLLQIPVAVKSARELVRSGP
jgi:hypothetical protein